MNLLEKNIKIYCILLLLIIIAQTIFTVYIVSTTQESFILRHYLGFLSLILIVVLFFINFNLGRVLLGVILLIGLFGGIVLTPSVQTVFLSFNIGKLPIPIFYGQPIFLLWFVLHLIASYKIYYGAGTKSYWIDLFNKKDAF